MNPVEVLEENGFEVNSNGELFTVISKATGAVIYRTATRHTIEALARGIKHSVPIDVDKAWKRPIRETGWHIVRG